MIFKSGYIPPAIGVLLIIASLGYLIDSSANFLLSNYADYREIFAFVVGIAGVVGELSFCLWLLFNVGKISEIKLSV